MIKNISSKEEIRRVIYKKRCSLSSKEIERKSSKITEILRDTLEFRNSKDIMFYVATRSEVQTEEIIKKSLLIGKNVSVPIMLNGSNNLSPSVLINFDKELKKRKKGILEPEEKYVRVISPEKLDLIILPGIAFDYKGNRIGRGMGYYDRFLKKINYSAKIIALSFEMQIVDKIPVDANDISVHKIITEKRVIKTANNIVNKKIEKK
ncbi:MAG: 5-formyltetrahydrofolate cyclo-ligase [Candidatus Caldatribacteriota bacterium]|nr:5-formyltetrahydrofolate cyclo-ligase [Candidatus Caldatribacteriota bacterium]